MVRMIDAYSHVRGESVFIDDMTLPQGCLHAAVVLAPAVGRIIEFNPTPAKEMDGVVGVFGTESIPGENQIGGIIPDEPLFAVDETHYIGQPMAIIVAKDRDTAFRARQAVEIEIEKRPVITSAIEADRLGRYLFPPRHMEIGDVDSAWSTCDLIVEGETESGFQEHLYLETQGCVAIPQERGHIRLFASTQAPTAVQRTAAKVLDLPMHLIEVEVLRLGGAFGGKEDQATPWAVMTALACLETKRAVKLVLERADDMVATGKRHPYSSKYRLGLSKDRKLVAFEVTYLQNGGACADLSPAILERTVCHATGSYFIPNVRLVAKSCKTDLPPNTAFRGFGGPQALFVIEAAIANAAKEMGCHPSLIQMENLLQEGHKLPFGQIMEACHAQDCWTEHSQRYPFESWLAKRDKFNSKNKRKKMGIAMMPICFGISFNKSSMNQAGALVHIYQDGSVGISTAAVEMGQGVNTKLVHIASQVLGISHYRVRIEPTNTTRVANTSPTAASSAADLNGKAVEKACLMLKSRLIAHMATSLDVSFKTLEIKQDKLVLEGSKVVTWNDMIDSAFNARIDLSEHAYYATPEIYFDKETNQGKPFAYHSYGTAMVTAVLDRLLGTYTIEDVLIVHDFGKSLNRKIDLGQMEGGLAQGIGWMTLEEIAYSEEGRLLAPNLSNYKVPDLNACAKRVEVHFLETKGNQKAVFGSKAIGEPPLLYGIGAYYALLDALKTCRNVSLKRIVAPMTPERAFQMAHSGQDIKVFQEGDMGVPAK